MLSIHEELINAIKLEKHTYEHIASYELSQLQAPFQQCKTLPYPLVNDLQIY